MRFASRFYDAKQLELLGWLLRSGCEDITHSIVIEWEQLDRVPVRVGGQSLVLISGNPPGDLASHPDARDLLLQRASQLGAYATVILHPGARLTEASWLNQVKHAFAQATRAHLERMDHPLYAAAVAQLPITRAEELSADPIAFIELVDAALRFQLSRIRPKREPEFLALGAGDDGAEPNGSTFGTKTDFWHIRSADWQYALDWTAADRIAQRLASAHSAESRLAAWDAARILLRIPLPATGDVTAAGQVLQRAGLADVDHTTISLGALARGAEDANLAARLREALRRHGFDAMPELLESSRISEASGAEFPRATLPGEATPRVVLTAKKDLDEKTARTGGNDELLGEVLSIRSIPRTARRKRRCTCHARTRRRCRLSSPHQKGVRRPPG